MRNFSGFALKFLDFGYTWAMFLIDKEFNGELEIKKSKFLAFLAPYSHFHSLKAELKIKHEKSAHIVWAYRYLNDFDQIVENSSDDGEPKGSSAPAVLNALRGADLINACCLVVRYFGGIKLGIGGLARAYGTSANTAILATSGHLIQYIKKENFCLVVPFSLISRIEHFSRTNNFSFNQNFIQNGCEFSFMLSDEQKEILSKFAKGLNLEF